MPTNIEIIEVLNRIIKNRDIKAIKDFARNPQMDISCPEGDYFNRREWDDLCDTYRAKVIEMFDVAYDISNDPHLFLELLLREKWSDVVAEFLKKHLAVLAQLISRLNATQCTELLLTTLSIIDVAMDADEPEIVTFQEVVVHLLSAIECMGGKTAPLARIILRALHAKEEDDLGNMTIRDIITVLSDVPRHSTLKSIK